MDLFFLIQLNEALATPLALGYYLFWSDLAANFQCMLSFVHLRNNFRLEIAVQVVHYDDNCM